MNKATIALKTRHRQQLTDRTGVFFGFFRPRWIWCQDQKGCGFVIVVFVFVNTAKIPTFVSVQLQRTLHSEPGLGLVLSILVPGLAAVGPGVLGENLMDQQSAAGSLSEELEVL